MALMTETHAFLKRLEYLAWPVWSTTMPNSTHIYLTSRQATLLGNVQRHGLNDGEWFRPMDIGAHDGSDHSNILRELVPKGLVERKLRGGSVRSYLYRLTDAGRAWQG